MFFGLTELLTRTDCCDCRKLLAPPWLMPKLPPPKKIIRL
jgi:hypothetical protein